MVAILTFSFGLVIYRLPLLRARNELDSWLSREAAFLVNNWILLFSAFFVLFATMFPTLSEAITGERLTVAAPFFNKWMVPIGLDPAVAHRHRPAAGVAEVDAQATCAISSCSRSIGAAVVARRDDSSLRIPIWSCRSVLRAVRVRRRHGRPGVLARRERPPEEHRHRFFTALVGLVGRNKRRYGGYIVHVGIVLIFLGFAGNAYKLDEQVLLKPGEETTIGRYTIRNDGIKVADDGQKQMTTAYIVGVRERQADRRAYPARWVFRQHENEPTDRSGHPPHARPKISTSCSARFELGDQTATLEMHRQPARQLDLARLRRHGVRHRHRAAAGARHSRSRWPSCRRKPRRRRRWSLLAFMLFGDAADQRAAARHGRRRGYADRPSTRARRSRSRCSTRSSARAAAAATRTSPSAERTPAATVA